MKQLRRYIRQILLTEGMNTAALFPEDVVVVIDTELDTEVGIHYAVVDTSTGEPHYIRERDRIKDLEGNRIYGKVEILSIPENYDVGPCSGAWAVGRSRAASGWGPLLYDVAIEWATQNAAGLIADRTSVSGSAEAVWRYYMQNRKDVTAHQLDDPIDTLTSEKEDNCDQEVAGGYRWGSPSLFRKENPENPDCMNSALSKRYTKEPTTINALKAAGKLVIL